MKNKFNSVTTSALVVAMGVAISTAYADQIPSNNNIQSQLSSVAAPELPVQAAAIVAAARADSLEATTKAVITAVANLKPAATLSVVSAIAKQNPAVAAVAAVQAATLQPKQAAWIARAAAAAAPSQAANIVAALCKLMPAQYSVIATAVAQAVPGDSKEILDAVASAVPTLKSYIEEASATYQGSSVGVVLAEVDQLIQYSLRTNFSSTGQPLLSMASVSSPGVSPMTATPAALSIPLPPPIQTPPITPPPASPVEISYTNSVQVPPGGGRDYSGG